MGMQVYHVTFADNDAEGYIGIDVHAESEGEAHRLAFKQIREQNVNDELYIVDSFHVCSLEEMEAYERELAVDAQFEYEWWQATKSPANSDWDDIPF